MDKASAGQRARSTADPVPAAVLAADVEQLLDVIEGGGIAIFPLDVTYAIVGHTPSAVRGIFAAKNRSYDKPCGLFGSPRHCRELHDLPAEKHEIARVLAEEEKLPFSVVAPYRASHPLLARVAPEVLAVSTRAGTMDMVVSAGYWLDALAVRSLARGIAVFGSSANRSLSGSKYRLEDIEPEVRAVAGAAFDYGVSRWATPLGLSSTIIDFRDFSVVRVGHCFAELEKVMRARFGITLRQ